MVVSPGGAVMVTGMWIVLLFRTAWLALVEFFWLSASSCFSPRLMPLRIGCNVLEARPSSSASSCLSLGEKKYRFYHRHHYTPLPGCFKLFLPNEAHTRKTGWPPTEKTITYSVWQKTVSRFLLPWFLNTLLDSIYVQTFYSVLGYSIEI